MKKYHRVHDESKIFGVCSGIGNYTNTDPLIWRLVFFFSIFTPFPIIMTYLLMWIIIPKEGDDNEEFYNNNNTKNY